jgi:[ribosomal protein S18]-alanine N-acetyltransferase
LEHDAPVPIRLATSHDIPAMTSLERACETAAHWTEEQYRQAIRPGSGDPERLVLVAVRSSAAAARTQGREPRTEILGFLVARHLAPEWELENIVVALVARRHGLGKQLMEALFVYAREAQSEAVFLEVRESNTAARKLYESAGFQQIGRRKCYYANPLEDAICYRRSPV